MLLGIGSRLLGFVPDLLVIFVRTPINSASYVAAVGLFSGCISAKACMIKSNGVDVMKGLCANLYERQTSMLLHAPEIHPESAVLHLMHLFKLAFHCMHNMQVVMHYFGKPTLACLLPALLDHTFL